MSDARSDWMLQLYDEQRRQHSQLRSVNRWITGLLLVAALWAWNVLFHVMDDDAHSHLRPVPTVTQTIHALPAPVGGCPSPPREYTNCTP